MLTACGPTAAAAESVQDSRAVIDAKSAQLLVTAKVKELQQAVQDAAAENAMLVNANLINPDVRFCALTTAQKLSPRRYMGQSVLKLTLIRYTSIKSATSFWML